MKQRLIDANAYIPKVCTYRTTGCGSCDFQSVCPYDEPDIEAIPIDWINDWAKRTLYDKNGRYNGEGYDSVWDMLDAWEKENEAK